MKLVFSAILVASTACVANADILSFLSTQVNPFGVPANGTGVAVYVDTDGSQPVTAQQWTINGNLINIDAPATGAGNFLTPGQGNRVQKASETALANVFDGGISMQFEADDSYWGNFFTSATLGGGLQGGDASDGSGPSSMGLEGGTTFGSNPGTSELLLYVVITAPVEVDGELAIGSSTIEGFDGQMAPWGIFPDGSIMPLIPEPTSLALAGMCLMGLVFRRGRRG